MGSLCSKSAVHSGGHTVLGPVSDYHPASSAPPNPRVAAAEAAERRLKAADRRGVNPSNPNQGQLAAKVAKQSSKQAPRDREEERLVVSLCLLQVFKNE
ncbi:hypothetical protein K443DRAFT_129544 [Laccaria amethystina LaAM-08-1]|uniref:Uncharacterized protein n=1 Tax=Laccaria amethystina LaAM-08-1 TaxID=1095629 RepID=A0A0C9XPD5_9AGAR|nr:hypothetical protein K443DRAFT_129544 [Laccaria amethystina LaAM-08-1]